MLTIFTSNKSAPSAPQRRFGLGLSRGPGLTQQLDASRSGRADTRAPERSNWTPPTAREFSRVNNPNTIPIQLVGDTEGTQRIGDRVLKPGERITLEYDQAEGVLLDRSGHAVMFGLTPSDVHDPTELGTYLAGYNNENFRHEEAAQVIPVTMDEDKYRTFNSSAAFKPVTVKTDDDATPAEVKVTSSLTNYKVVVRRIAAFIPDPTAKQVSNSGYDLRFVHMKRCKRAINMDLELDVLGSSGLLTTSGNWNSNNAVALAANYAWGDTTGNSANAGALSDPIADLNARIVASAALISGWMMNHRVALCFLSHEKVRSYMRQWLGDANATSIARQVAQARGAGVFDFELPMIGAVKVNTARVESNTAGTTTDYIMPNVVLGLTQPPGVPTNGEEIATAYNFRRKGPAGVGFFTREVRFDARGAGGTMIIVEEASIPTMTSTIAGGFIGDILQ